MEELKKQIMDKVNDLNQKWVTALTKGEQDGEIDLTVMFGEYSMIVKDIDKATREAEQRLLKKKKGTLW